MCTFSDGPVEFEGVMQSSEQELCPKLETDAHDLADVFSRRMHGYAIA